MQITETTNDGLKRTLKVVLGAGELNERFILKLDEVKDRVHLKGFRKGKVPVAHIKKMYGRSLMAEVLDDAVKETSQKALEERKERPALRPTISLPEDKEEIARVLTGNADFSYSMTFEVIPAISLIDFKALKLEKLVADVDDSEIDKALEGLVKRSITYAVEDGRAAESGDQVTLDFAGSIDGTPFEGGTATDAKIVIGEGGFIPGFEEGLIGVKAGETRAVTAQFPEGYPVDTLKGKEATFEVTVKEVAKSMLPPVDDDFAKSLGAETLEKLRDLVRANIAREYASVSRVKLKRDLFDALDAGHTFELPPSLVAQEFDSIWRKLVQDMEENGKSFADDNLTEDDGRAKYQRIAERRVRLGLVMGDIGEKSKVEVTPEELRRALVDRVRRYPGQEKLIYDYYQNTPGAIAELRAPIFEDKVMDLILAQANPIEKKVSKDELLEAVNVTGGTEE